MKMGLMIIPTLTLSPSDSKSHLAPLSSMTHHSDDYMMAGTHHTSSIHGTDLVSRKESTIKVRCSSRDNVPYGDLIEEKELDEDGRWKMKMN